MSFFCCRVWVAFGQRQFKAHFPPGGTCCDSLALAQRDIFLSCFLTECSRDHGGHQDAWSLPGNVVPAGDAAGNPNCSSCSCTLGQSSREPWAGLPDPGVDQQFDLWSVSKESSILLTDFKLMCVLALLFAVSSLPSLALFLVTTVLFYLAPFLCISPSSMALLLILPPLSHFFSFFCVLLAPTLLTSRPAVLGLAPGLALFKTLFSCLAPK